MAVRKDGAKLVESYGDGIESSAKILVQAKVVGRQKPQGSKKIGLLPFREKQMPGGSTKGEMGRQVARPLSSSQRPGFALHFLSMRIPSINHPFI